jgi:hypothetical protein
VIAYLLGSGFSHPASRALVSYALALSFVERGHERADQGVSFKGRCLLVRLLRADQSKARGLRLIRRI